MSTATGSDGKGADVAEYVIACNVTRRHMSKGSRAMVVALMLVKDGRRDNGRWKYGQASQKLTELKSGSSFGVQVSWAGTVLDFKPDLAAEVVNGIGAGGDAASADAYCGTGFGDGLSFPLLG